MASRFEVWVPGEQRYYRDPIEIIEAFSQPNIAPALIRSDNALRAGRSIAGFITYEAGVMLEGSTCSTELAPNAPLLMLGVFDGPRQGPVTLNSGAALGPFVASTTWAEYQRNFVRYGSQAIVSCSPELFLEFSGSTVCCKPMKGTSRLDALSELQNEKNRAEHVMIVDLMRNDLGRIGPAPRTTGLFTAEPYPTFATMTTTIEADLAADVGLADVFAATLPAGSITGAPKRAAITQIAQREAAPRGIAMGCIGFQESPVRGVWNTAIRTLEINTDRSEATIRIGPNNVPLSGSVDCADGIVTIAQQTGS